MQKPTVEVTRRVARSIQPGETEKQIADRYIAALAEAGLSEHWYPVLVYVGESTSLPISRRYHLPSDSVAVQENDIVMLDCTPLNDTVWSNWAETFVIGTDEFYQVLIDDAYTMVDRLYEYADLQAKTIGDIYNLAVELMDEYGLTSLDPMGDVGHSIFQVPAGQRVEDTPMEDRTFIFPAHGDRPIEGILSIEPQVGRAHPATGKMYSAKIQKVIIK